MITCSGSAWPPRKTTFCGIGSHAAWVHRNREEKPLRFLNSERETILAAFPRESSVRRLSGQASIAAAPLVSGAAFFSSDLPHAACTYSARRPVWPTSICRYEPEAKRKKKEKGKKRTL
ncbi:hypothetical protein MRX96_029441 [Rhipicephalus microplus]